MKTPIKTLALLTGAALFSFSTLTAVETDPVGYKTVTIKGDNGLTLVGIEFLETPAYSGQVSGVGANTVTVAGVDFDSLLASGTAYFLDLTDSATPASVGINTNVVSWSGSTLTLGDDLAGALVADADIIRIHALPTIGSVFGVGGDVLEGGTSVTADLLFMADPESTGLLKLYYSISPFTGTGWRIVGREGEGDKSTLPIYFSDGLYVFKKSSGDASLTFSGNVKMTASSTVIEPGFTPISTIYPSGTTLANSGLYDSESPSNSISAGTAVTADLVLMDSDGDGNIEKYYYSSSPFTGIGWRDVDTGTTDKSGVELPSSVAIFNRGVAVTLNREPAY